MRNYFYALMALATATMTGCAMMDENDPEEYTRSSEVSFTIDADAPVKAGTRGTPINSEEEMTTMGVFGAATGTTDWSSSAPLNKAFNEQLEYSNGEWDYVDGSPIRWQAETAVDRYTFFAYAPYAETANGITLSGSTSTTGIPTLTYTVPTNVTNQPDLMVAVPVKDVRPSGAKVKLQMKHALTSVAFQIMGNGEKVKGIHVEGISTSGTLKIDGGTIQWLGLSDPTDVDYSASLNSELLEAGSYTTTPTMTTNLIAGDGYLMMIPNASLPDGAKVVVTYSDNTTKELSLAGHTWAPGKLVTYQIDLPVGGILAPPGVIGYVAGSNILTLRGSKEYSADTDIANYAKKFHSEGLYPSTVYAAYFQFGSLIAISSDPNDENPDAGGSYIQANDIITGPQGYDLAGLKATPTWAGIPVYNNNGTDFTNNILDISAAAYNTPENAALGKGDPCQYYFTEGNWVTPSGSPYNGTPNYSIDNLLWKDADALGEGLPAGRLSDREGEKGMFYPISLERDYTDGAVGRRTPVEPGFLLTDGSYWASTAGSATNGDGLPFTSTGVHPIGYSANHSYGFLVRCVEAIPTITVDPAEHLFDVLGGSKTFDVTTTNFTGTVQVTETATWITSASMTDANTLTVTADSNTTGTGARSATVTLTAGTISKTVTIRQEAPGVRAVQGVIGYYGAGPKWGTGELTLAGDNSIDSDGEVIYVAYFKGGSLIATSSQNNGDFTAHDVIAVPTIATGGFLQNLDTYKANITGEGATAWNKINDALDSGLTFVAGDNLAERLNGETHLVNGLGDPCVQYFGAQGYRMPTNQENIDFVGKAGLSNNGESYNGKVYYEWLAPTGGTASAVDPGFGKFLSGTVPNATLPAAGSRDNRGSVYYQGVQGHYWASTLYINNENGLFPYQIDINNTRVSSNSNLRWEYGTSIRCIAPEPIVPEEGILAPPGVIGYKKSTGELTLKGSTEYSSNAAIKKYAEDNLGGLETETVYVAYFKFGSLVALSSDPTDKYDMNPNLEANDFVAAPSEWSDELAALKADPDWAGIPTYTLTDYNSGYGISDITLAGYQAPASAKGDPCQYYFGSGWVTPSGDPYNGVSYSNTTLPWQSVSATIPSAGRISAVTGEEGMFYPAAGSRYGVGAISGQGSYGYYWTSTFYTWDEHGWGHVLSFNSASTVNAKDHLASDQAYGVRCVPAPEPDYDGGQADILYFDKNDNNRLKIGRWGEDVTSIEDMVFTQFGSVVGFTNGTSWDSGDILFNPMSSTPAGYTSIPNYGTDPTAWTGSAATSPLVSAPEYHNGTNILAGRGDICRLVGLTSAQAKAMTAQQLSDYKSGWRLPTKEENNVFIGVAADNNSDIAAGSDYYTWTASNPSTGTFPKNKYYQAGVNDVTLPTTGYRDGINNGSVGYSDYGYYWSSTASGNILRFFDEYLTRATIDYTYGLANRCIATGETPTVVEPLVPAGVVIAPPGVIGYKADGTLTLKGSTEYKDNAAIKKYADDNFNGLENETVWVAYFKFGSLIALSSDPKDRAVGTNGNYIQADDIIAGPQGYDLATLKANLTWAGIPVFKSGDYYGGIRDISAAAYNTPANAVLGKGDPCQYYFTDGNWVTPSGQPYNGYEETDFSAWSAANGDIPVGRFIDGTGEFYPAAGSRGLNYGDVASPGVVGIYWSSSAISSSEGKNLSLNKTDVYLSYSETYATASNVRCFVPAPKINIAPTTSHNFTYLGGTTTFTVTATNYTGTIGVSNSDAWITAKSLVGNTLTVTVAPSTISTTRTGTITLTAGTTTATVTITQDVGGVIAPPGVIGYTVDGRLTLKGSKEYSTNTAIKSYADANFSGLENETVYVAQFKFGSLVALTSDPDDSNSPYFEATDIIAAPTVADGYMGIDALKLQVDGATGANADEADDNRYALIPGFYDNASTLDIASSTYNTPANKALGLGDPCQYYFGSDWKTPSGNSYNGNAESDFTYKTENAAGQGIPPGWLSGKTGEEGWFYPAAGYRNNGGNAFISSARTVGAYWSSTARNYTQGYQMSFNTSTIGVTGWDDSRTSHGIRCVPAGPKLNGGENHVLYFTGDPDQPLAVGRWDTSLTAEDEADGVIRLTSANYYDLAFFKYGSVIGFTNGSDWSNDEIKFNPSSLIVGTNITGYGNDSTTLPAIPGYTAADYSNNILNVSDAAYHNAAKYCARQGRPLQVSRYGHNAQKRLGLFGKLR